MYFFLLTRYKITFLILCNTLYNQHIKKTIHQSFYHLLENKIHNKNKFYVFSHLYLTIYFLSVKKTRTHVPFLFLFVVSLWQQIGSGQTRCGNLKKITYCWWSSTWADLGATASLTCRIHTMAAVGVAKKNKQTAVLLQWAFGAATFQSGFNLL